MANNNFIPTLGNASDDVLTDPINTAEYLVAFTIINPGFTSENYEYDMLSLSSLLAQYELEVALEKYEIALQSLITSHIPDSNYIVSVTAKEVSDIDVNIEIIVGDIGNVNILRQEHLIKRLRKE